LGCGILALFSVDIKKLFFQITSLIEKRGLKAVCCVMGPNIKADNNLHFDQHAK
jgi:hypothetical protein